MFILGVATSLADFNAARGRDYAAAANYTGHYQGFLDVSRASHQFGWHNLPPALHSMQGKSHIQFNEKLKNLRSILNF